MVNLPHWLIRVNDAESRDVYPNGDRALDGDERKYISHLKEPNP